MFHQMFRQICHQLFCMQLQYVVVAKVSWKVQRGTWLPYAEILARSISKAAQEVLQLELSPREATAFAATATQL